MGACIWLDEAYWCCAHSFLRELHGYAASATMRSSMGRLLSTVRAVSCVFGALVCAGSVLALPQDGSREAIAPTAQQQGAYLVFPFENAGTSPRLDWLGEGIEELTIQHLSAAGQEVYSHAGRAGELERYGLPVSAKLSRATMLRIAQDLDADFVVFGSFTSDGTSLRLESRILRVDPASLLAPVVETGSLDSLMEMSTKLAWDLVRSNDPKYATSLEQFSKVQHNVRLDAFEHYVRGLLASEDEPRLRELREAARLEPGWADPEFGLGETYFARNDCESALPWFAHISRTYARYVEALFATGVCRLQLNQPDRAEEMFTALQNSLRGDSGSSSRPEGETALSGADLPEILNDLAIARARQNKMAEAQADLQRATELDPDDDDYPFNLGLLAFGANDFAAAADHFREAVGREPDSAEDREFLIEALEKAGKKDEAEQEREEAEEAMGPNALSSPLTDVKGDKLSKKERLKTELDITALRLEIESGNLATNAAAAAEARGGGHDSHLRRGRQELSAGHLEDAQKEFEAALGSGEPGGAAAHLGLGEIAKRRGKLDDAVKELQASLDARDSAVVRTTLAKVYLEQKRPDLARGEVQRALKLAPNYVEAKQLLEHLQNSKPNGGGQ